MRTTFYRTLVLVLTASWNIVRLSWSLLPSLTDISKGKSFYCYGKNPGRGHDHPKVRRSPRISKPVEQMQCSYDVVVIGSGYGGGVAASRMARARQTVCLLELGEERWPGEFPSKLREAVPEVHISGHYHRGRDQKVPVNLGKRAGLYRLMLGAGQNIFVGIGLGGSSLLNANVFLRADDRTLALPEWPEQIRRPSSLEDYYKRAEAMLEPRVYPSQFPPLAKMELLRKQALSVGYEHHFSRAPLTTTFHSGHNSVGVPMRSNTLTGQECTGANDGSKTTTLVTYLADAWRWGADIFCGCEVKYIKRHPEAGYVVLFKHDDQLMWVHARKFVFLGAGSMGTTEIMLRSKERGLSLSEKIGTNMSGNGSMLGFGMHVSHELGASDRRFCHSGKVVGPVISGTVDVKSEGDVRDGFVIQEGAIPTAIVRLLPFVMPFLRSPTLGSLDMLQQFRRHLLMAFGLHGVAKKTQVYLSLSHDRGQGSIVLENGRPYIDFRCVGRSNTERRLRKLLSDMTHAFGGTFVEWTSRSSTETKQQDIKITVHPLGGMLMSRDGTADLGATTHAGEVLTGDTCFYHDGLIVVDGSVVPTSLGINPFATITALAERSVAIAASKKGMSIDYETINGELDLFTSPSHYQSNYQIPTSRESQSRAGIRFTEVMKGTIGLHRCSEYGVFGEFSKDIVRNEAQLSLCVQLAESGSGFRGTITGSLNLEEVRGSPYMISEGKFWLFEKDPTVPEQLRMTYDFDAYGTDGSKLFFHGEKLLNSSVAFSPVNTWRAVTNLRVHITRPDGSTFGIGALRLRPYDLLGQLKSFAVVGKTTYDRQAMAIRFFHQFTCRLTRSLFAPFAPIQYPQADAVEALERADRRSVPDSIETITARDGVKSCLRMWKPRAASESFGNGEMDILFIPGAAVDHQIFALATIPENAVDYFTGAGHRCWCLTHRVGRTPLSQQARSTTFDARLDIEAALLTLYRRKGRQKANRIYVIAHCAGAIALAAGLLDGSIWGTWIGGITASNVFCHPVFARVNAIKAASPVSLVTLYRAIVGPWFSCVSPLNDTLVERLLNQLLRFYPVDTAKELCTSVTCHRAALAFGRLWSHKNLNAATHDQLHNILGGVSTRCLQHLLDMGIQGTVLDSAGRNLVTPSNLDRLRGIPLLLFSGSENAVYAPAATSASCDLLNAHFRGDYCTRLEFEGMGHLDCWMSESAAAPGGVFDSVKANIDSIFTVPKTQEENEKNAT